MSGERRVLRLRSQSGQATVELGALVGLVLLVGLIAWQLALIGWTAVSAQNAARTAARMQSRGGDGAAAGRHALAAKGLSHDADVQVTGDQATVVVPVPIVVPALHAFGFHLTETATMPHTG